MDSPVTPHAIVPNMPQTSGHRRLKIVVVLLALVAGALWFARARRDRAAHSDIRAVPSPVASLTFEALVDSAASMGARFRSEMDTIPRPDDVRRLQSTIDYLKTVTYLYYDWASDSSGTLRSPDAITRGYLLPAVESVLEARPELAAAYPGVRGSAVVRLYFLDHRMLLTHGVLLSTSGLGRFPSLELAPIVRDIPLDQVVWGRQIDAVGFDLQEPIILDIVSYAHGGSTGANMRTMNTLVLHHLDREANFVESLRDEFRHARQGTPGPARDGDTLMRGLEYVALQPYMALDEESAVREFLDDWSETSYMHEAGHVFSRQADLGLTPQTPQEEALAYLTELRYGELPHYTLRNMYSVGTMQGIEPHKGGMEIVFTEFSQRILAAKIRGEGFDAIDVNSLFESVGEGGGFGGIAYEFPKLRADEIRALADEVFEETYRPLVDE